jgi:serine/threonine protein kinase
MGQIIDNRYQIIEKIGEGGMGAVYLAEDLRLRRKVAIKRLQLMGKQADLQHFQQRFEREALEMASFQHANIVHVYDYGHDDRGIYLVLEYMPGGTLSDRMQAGAVPVAEAVAIMLPLADALQAIHERERVHRDIKPSNILFDGYSKPKLADFGVVKLLAGQEGHTLTGTGAAVGTPAYMAPELIGGEASPATDQYALGMVLYELVTGKKPFLGRTPMETLFFQQTRPLPDPLTYNPHLPTWLCAALHTMLAKDPSARFAGMPAFMEALTAGSDTPPERQQITPPPPEPVAEMPQPLEEEHTFDLLSEIGAIPLINNSSKKKDQSQDTPKPQTSGNTKFITPKDEVGNYHGRTKAVNKNISINQHTIDKKEPQKRRSLQSLSQKVGIKMYIVMLIVCAILVIMLSIMAVLFGMRYLNRAEEIVAPTTTPNALVINQSMSEWQVFDEHNFLVFDILSDVTNQTIG